jgi:hypothetical protein
MVMARLWCAVWVLLTLTPAMAAPTETEMCQIIRNDIAAYLATGNPCPCPYSKTRTGRGCGNLSAWAKPEGKIPRCYFEDVDGTLPPNRRPNPTRQRWPDPPPCNPMS